MELRECQVLGVVGLRPPELLGEVEASSAAGASALGVETGSLFHIAAAAAGLSALLASS